MSVLLHEINFKKIMYNIPYGYLFTILMYIYKYDKFYM